jgi:vacuolar-type H+-ATPase subunit H
MSETSTTVVQMIEELRKTDDVIAEARAEARYLRKSLEAARHTKTVSTLEKQRIGQALNRRRAPKTPKKQPLFTTPPKK